MKCRRCDTEMIQKNRGRLIAAGVLMLASLALAWVIPYFWAPGIILSLTGGYLLIWATLGRACWCRNCKTFNVVWPDSSARNRRRS